MRASKAFVPPNENDRRPLLGEFIEGIETPVGDLNVSKLPFSIMTAPFISSSAAGLEVPSPTFPFASMVSAVLVANPAVEVDTPKSGLVPPAEPATESLKPGVVVPSPRFPAKSIVPKTVEPLLKLTSRAPGVLSVLSALISKATALAPFEILEPSVNVALLFDLTPILAEPSKPRTMVFALLKLEAKVFASTVPPNDEAVVEVPMKESATT
jgi:hypothetical protein